MSLRVVIAPQAFKQSVGARAAAVAIGRGVRRVAPDAQTTLIPVADGGDGTLAALIETSGGRYFEASVSGPLGEPLMARWGAMGDGRTAVIEMALASGLALLGDEQRDPRRATTYGVGQLMGAALDAGYARIIVGLGGSATNDGGAGMASALGVRFRTPRAASWRRAGRRWPIWPGLTRRAFIRNWAGRSSPAPRM